MRISQLIAVLYMELRDHGDVEVHTADTDDGSLRDPAVEWVDGNLVVW